MHASRWDEANERPYSPTGPCPQLPRTFGAWAMDLDFLNSRQRLGQTLNLLRFRVRLNEYYNFGRIERGRHGCFFASRKWPSEASKHHFFPLRSLGEGCALWGARKSSLTWGRRAKNADFLARKLS